MGSRDESRQGRNREKAEGAESGGILPFPLIAAPADILVDRLRNGNPALAASCVADWADPLDAAILAALLLRRPAVQLETRERVARAHGRQAEAGFWHDAGRLLVAITSVEGCGR